MAGIGCLACKKKRKGWEREKLDDYTFDFLTQNYTLDD
jgi:hypothetical protein